MVSENFPFNTMTSTFSLPARYKETVAAQNVTYKNKHALIFYYENDATNAEEDVNSLKRLPARYLGFEISPGWW